MRRLHDSNLKGLENRGQDEDGDNKLVDHKKMKHNIRLKKHGGFQMREKDLVWGRRGFDSSSYA